MTRDAVQRGLRAFCRILIPVAVDAPAHAQRADDGAGQDQVDQVGGDEVTEAVGAHARHALDGAVAGLAFDAGADVGLVGEVGELGDLEDAHPGNRLARFQ